MAYYKTVTITGQAGAGTDYQVMLKVGETSGATGEDFDVENHATSFPSAKDDGGDLIFKNSDGSSNLSFWVEDVTGITPNRLATIWVEVADNLDSNKTIRCYYGHTSYSNLSNGANTFTFFDDFPGTSLDTGKWTTRGGSWAVANSVLTNTGTVLDGNKCLVDSPATANNYAMRSKMQNDYHNTSINYRMGLVSFANSSVNYDGYSYLIDRDTVTPPLLQKAFVDEYVAWDTRHAFAWTQDTWYTMELSHDGTDIRARIDDGSWVTWTRSGRSGGWQLSADGQQANSLTDFDWALIRKCIVTEPSFSSSGSETSTSVAAGYDYKRTITVDNTKVSGASNLTDFPMLIGGTYSYLKDTGNGGKVTDSNGYDIEFSSDSDGVVKLPHEIERYINTTGEIVFWVNIPDLDYNDDTVIYMWYGNSSVSTSQENVNGTWNTNHKAVYHLKEDPTGGSPQFTDSTSSGLNGSAVGTWASGDSQPGQVGYAIELGGAVYISTGDAGITEGTAWTVRMWGRTNTTTTGNSLWSEGQKGSFYNMYLGDQAMSGGIRTVYENPGGVALFNYNTDLSDDQWYMIHIVQTALDDRKLYVNGVNVGTNDTTSRTATTTAESYLGVTNYDGFVQLFTGWVDEARYMTSALTTGELVTQYNNESAPSTFYAVGAETPVGVVGTHIFGDEGLVA